MRQELCLKIEVGSRVMGHGADAEKVLDLDKHFEPDAQRAKVLRPNKGSPAVSAWEPVQKKRKLRRAHYYIHIIISENN